MAKALANEESAYLATLLPEEKEKYLQKCRDHVKGIDPFTYKLIESQTHNEDVLDPFLLPSVDLAKIIQYLVLGEQKYTIEQFLNYKSLEPYKQFSDKAVHDLHMMEVPETENTLIGAKVVWVHQLAELEDEPTRTLVKKADCGDMFLYEVADIRKPKVRHEERSVWVVTNSEGDIQTSHCSCMTGCGETCDHVEAMLFKMEAVVLFRKWSRRSDVPNYCCLPSSLRAEVKPRRICDMDFSSGKKRKKKTGIKPQPAVPEPIDEEKGKKFFQALYDAGIRSPAVMLGLGKEDEINDPVQPADLPDSS